ncbi:hypothetical protein C8R41DRAFT_812796 [Lentinula lateritia]|uniref:Secreted protein n=1 Tax=Lentinula lateritia TaxID=40482 RepID=A0ABQ8VUD2_9AGAR|nr:hypothetical protein C8R41DRAFT_812796 [Lentinula lateritia]
MQVWTSTSLMFAFCGLSLEGCKVCLFGCTKTHFTARRPSLFKDEDNSTLGSQYTMYSTVILVPMMQDFTTSLNW